MRHWLMGSVIVSVATLAAGAAFAQRFDGTWSGTGRQLPAGDQAEWPIVMTLSGDGGTIEYPSLHCGGTLTLVSRQGINATYRETITHGREACVNEETVTLRLFHGRARETMVWRAQGDAGGVRYGSVATLTRQRANRG